MTVDPDETTAAGTCPLCHAAVPVPPEPRLAGDVIAMLGTHFAATCPATVLASAPRRLA